MLKRLRNLFARRGEAAKSTASTETRDADRPRVHVGPKVVHRPIAASDIDIDAMKIVQRLSRFDHKAYLVGGCVRDLLLDRSPKDFDIGTSATPRQIKRLFRNCRIIGRRFRLAHIYFQNGKIIEVATFRARNGTDDAAGDDDLLIRDDNLFGTPEEDALRRDFTINQLFYDVNDETVLDHADGLTDLRLRLVRTVGEPEIRFREDPIRILRAIKFAARLEFGIEDRTLAAIEATRDEIPKAAAPRILEEINRFCRGGAARRSFELSRETGVFRVILSELAKDYDDLSWRRLDAMTARIDRRLADGHETGTGAIFAALLAPPVLRRAGWAADGSIDVPKGAELRELIDDCLRPIALRLRIARRDQEHCRQVLGTLLRLAPLTPRRGSRRRPGGGGGLADALWLLDALAEVHGGDIAAAAEHWNKTVTPDDLAADREVEQDEDERSGAARRRRRRGGRRRSRGAADDGRQSGDRRDEGTGEAAGTRRVRRRRGGRGPSTEETGRTRPAPPSGRDAPRPGRWDDDYFFSALPTVPDLERDDGPDRYGATLVAPDDATPAATDDTPADDSRDDGDVKKKSRRRRRRRPRRPAASDGEASSADASGEPAADGGGAEKAAGAPRRRRRRRRRSRGGAGDGGDGAARGKPADDGGDS